MNEQNTNEEGLTKKERTEQKRSDKEREHTRRIRTRKIKKVVTWVIILAAGAGLIYWGIVAAKKAEENRLGEPVPIQGADHINVGDEHEVYNTNPPTSGPHGPAPKFGVYQEGIPDENVVHALEHGGIWISYKDLSEEDTKKLEDIGRQYPGRTVVSPRAANDSNIAVVSWGRLLKLDEVDVNQIKEYVRKNFNRSPEQLAR